MHKAIFGAGREERFILQRKLLDTITLPFGVFGSFNSVVKDNTGGIWVSTDTIVARYDGKSWTTFNIGDIFGIPR